MKLTSECSNQSNINYAAIETKKKNKNGFFQPKQENIDNFNSAKIQKKTQSLSINFLLFSLAILISFFIFHDALIFVAIIGVILLLSSAKTHLNSKQYHSLCDSKADNGEHQCVFCGNHGIYRCTTHNTNITECHCSKCKQHLFNE